MHEDFLWVNSQVGKGSAFFIALPADTGILSNGGAFFIALPADTGILSNGGLAYQNAYRPKAGLVSEPLPLADK